MGQNLLQRLIAQYDLIFFNAKIALEHKKRKQKKPKKPLYPEVVTEFSCHEGRVGKCIDGNLFIAFITAGDQETGPCIWSSDSKRHFLKYKKFHIRPTHSDCQGAWAVLQSGLHPCAHSEPNCPLSWAACSAWSCFEQESWILSKDAF